MLHPEKLRGSLEDKTLAERIATPWRKVRGISCSDVPGNETLAAAAIAWLAFAIVRFPAAGSKPKPKPRSGW